MVQQQVFSFLFFLFASFLLSIFIYINTHTLGSLVCCCPPFDGQYITTREKKRRRKRSQENARTRRDYKHTVSDQTTGTRAPATTTAPSSSSSSFLLPPPPPPVFIKRILYKGERGGGQTFIIGSVILPGKWRRKRIKTRARKWKNKIKWNKILGAWWWAYTTQHTPTLRDVPCTVRVSPFLIFVCVCVCVCINLSTYCIDYRISLEEDGRTKWPIHRQHLCHLNFFMSQEKVTKKKIPQERQ